jgi:hypothetical protein
MDNGSHRFKAAQGGIEMITVESLTKNPFDLSLEFITMVGTRAEFRQDQKIDIQE